MQTEPCSGRDSTGAAEMSNRANKERKQRAKNAHTAGWTDQLSRVSETLNQTLNCLGTFSFLKDFTDVSPG